MNDAKYIGMDVHTALGGDCASSTNHLLVNYMPPRTTRKSYRLRASDRTMVGIFIATALLVA